MLKKKLCISISKQALEVFAHCVVPDRCAIVNVYEGKSSHTGDVSPGGRRCQIHGGEKIAGPAGDVEGWPLKRTKLPGVVFCVPDFARLVC